MAECSENEIEKLRNVYSTSIAHNISCDVSPQIVESFDTREQLNQEEVTTLTPLCRRSIGLELDFTNSVLQTFNNFEKSINVTPKVSKSNNNLPETLNFSAIFDNISDNPNNMKFLNNTVVYVLYAKSSVNYVNIRNLVKTFGGTFVWKFDDTVTHVIYDGKLDSHLIEPYADKGLYLLSSKWIFSCENLRKKVEEETYACPK